MKCPNIETLIAVAAGKGGPEVADVVLHAAECPDCRQNLKIIHETMLASKWENASVEPKVPVEQDELRCSVCGTRYRSKSSLMQTCMENGCKAKICFDCWNVRGVRRCPDHSKN